MFTRKNKYHIYLTEEERQLVLKALIDKRNALIAAGRYTDAIDDIVSDKNGMIDTSASSRPHTNNTNSLDEYVDGGTFTNVYKLDPSVGVWFGDSEPDDSLGALPYGLYKVCQLPTNEFAGLYLPGGVNG